MTAAAPTLPRRAVRAAQRLVPRARRGATVLCYHLVGAGTVSAVDLPLPLFRRQMEELATSARVVPLAELLEPPEDGGRAEAKRRRVALTFDDAYANFARVALPVLEELRLPVTLFVPVGFVTGEGPPPNRLADLPALDRTTLAELAAGGLVEIGSHAWSHRDLPKLPSGEIRRELARSKEWLEETTGKPVTSFCYPRSLRDRRSEAEVARFYARAVLGGGRRAVPGSTDPLRIPRVSLRRDGPERLAPVLAATVWLEEWLADRVRRLQG